MESKLAEITVNKEAYSSNSEEYLYITDKGSVYVKNKPIPSNEKIIKKLLRSDSTNQNFIDLNLQTHNTPTSLDITSYNVYPQDGSKSEKPEEVIVGVAGSGDSSDWYQNLLKIDVRNPIN